MTASGASPSSDHPTETQIVNQRIALHCASIRQRPRPSRPRGPSGYNLDAGLPRGTSPASMSILEEATISVVLPMMGIGTIWSSTTDAACTWDLLLGKATEKLRTNPRKIRHQNVELVTANSDSEAVFHLKRPQPALLYRHPGRGAGRYRRRDAAALRRGLGNAVGFPQNRGRL